MLSLIVLLISVPTLTVSASNNTLNSTVILKLNQFYVVYTSPLAPYVDKENRLMVPLRSLSNLLSTDVTYNAANKTAVISRKNDLNASEKYYTIKMEVGKNKVEINGITSEMDTIPTLYKGSMFVPLSIITTAFHIDTTWDKSKNIVNLNVDPAYLPSGVVSDELHFLSDKINEDIRPIKSSVMTQTKSNGTHLANVRLTAVNEGTTTVLSNDLYLHFYVQDSNFSFIDIANKSLTEPGKTFTVQTAPYTILSDSLQYILVGVYNN
ncbi:stalk domain-containing protein [Paenibacillus terrigena]|uniref:stalk domain-containing protein n=1 Tax=Paenibacillus terrigena TaxID=369333 RepID=UPI0003730AFE|nr:stalk domain-containing protein [Paenibacillus terrigena]